MGSGSYGGGGGGAASRGGGGGGFFGGARGYHFDGGIAVAGVTSQNKIEKGARECLTRLSRNSKDYLVSQFCSPMIRGIFEHLLLLPAPIFQSRTWDNFAKRYGVGNGPGCLVEWADRVATKVEGEEPNAKVRETARVSLDDFLVTALDNDFDIYLQGNGEAIVSQLNPEIFKSASGYFIGKLVWRVLEREGERLPESEEVQLQEVAQRIADRLVEQFEHKFYARDQVTHRDIFRVFGENQEWLVQELRKK
jgi:GGDEF domain-containing protein